MTETPDIVITPLQWEFMGAPRLSASLMRVLNSPEVISLERALNQIDNFPPDLRQALFATLPEEEVFTEDIRDIRAGITKFKNGELPTPNELGAVACPQSALNQLAEALRDIKVGPEWISDIALIIQKVEQGSKRLRWSGAYGVKQWLGGLACGYQPHPLSSFTPF